MAITRFTNKRTSNILSKCVDLEALVAMLHVYSSFCHIITIVQRVDLLVTCIDNSLNLSRSFPELNICMLNEIVNYRPDRPTRFSIRSNNVLFGIVLGLWLLNK